MRILAIDTSTTRGSVALVDGGRVQAVVRLDAGQGRALAPAVLEVLGPQRTDAFDAIALSIGPGSFTGLRIGLSFVKGLVLAVPRPVLAVSTLELIEAAARPYAGSAPVLAAIDARNGEVFARLAGVIEEGLQRVDAVSAFLLERPAGIIAGEPPAALIAALPAWTAQPSEPGAVPLAVVLAGLAAPRLLAGEGRDPAPLQPSYGQPAAVDRKRPAVDTPASHT